MASTSLNGRTPDTVRREIEQERRELAEAVEQLRGGLSVRPSATALAAGALGAGFFLAGGIGATMRFLARKGRDR